MSRWLEVEKISCETFPQNPLLVSALILKVTPTPFGTLLIAWCICCGVIVLYLACVKETKCCDTVNLAFLYSYYYKKAAYNYGRWKIWSELVYVLPIRKCVPIIHSLWSITPNRCCISIVTYSGASYERMNEDVRSCRVVILWI